MSDQPDEATSNSAPTPHSSPSDGTLERSPEVAGDDLSRKHDTGWRPWADWRWYVAALTVTQSARLVHEDYGLPTADSFQRTAFIADMSISLAGLLLILVGVPAGIVALVRSARGMSRRPTGSGLQRLAASATLGLILIGSLGVYESVSSPSEPTPQPLDERATKDLVADELTSLNLLVALANCRGTDPVETRFEDALFDHVRDLRVARTRGAVNPDDYDQVGYEAYLALIEAQQSADDLVISGIGNVDNLNININVARTLADEYLEGWPRTQTPATGEDPELRECFALVDFYRARSGGLTAG